MIIREASVEDIDSLLLMRWEFTMEHQPYVQDDFDLFATECRAFQLIDKVPRPGHVTYPFAYMTNVYTDPDYRSQGVGSEMLQAISAWAKENKYEFIIVWPSEEAREFYSRNGYKLCDDPMELQL